METFTDDLNCLFCESMINIPFNFFIKKKQTPLNIFFSVRHDLGTSVRQNGLPYFLLMVHSSVVEHSAVNRDVASSNLAGSVR